VIRFEHDETVVVSVFGETDAAVKVMSYFFFLDIQIFSKEILLQLVEYYLK
jgi:hypothetical protein